MSVWYVPVNGYVEIEAESESEAYERTKETVRGLTDFDCGDASIIEEDEEENE